MKRRNIKKRTLALIITSPIWLLGVSAVFLFMIPWWILRPIVATIEYGFTGEWDWS